MAGRKTATRTATASTPEGELKRHLETLGLASVEGYRIWLRAHSLGSAIHKDWQARRQEAQIAAREAEAKCAENSLAQHRQLLKFETQAEYETWCRKHGFGLGRQKSPEALRQERETAERERCEGALVRSRRGQRRPEDSIRRLAAGTASIEELKAPWLLAIAEAFRKIQGQKTTREALLRLLLHVSAVGNLLGVEPVIPSLGAQAENTYIEGLLQLARSSRDWIRPPEDWRPDSHNARRQLGSLTRHLLACYAVPIFLDAAWLEGSRP